MRKIYDFKAAIQCFQTYDLDFVFAENSIIRKFVVKYITIFFNKKICYTVIMLYTNLLLFFQRQRRLLKH